MYLMASTVPAHTTGSLVMWIFENNDAMNSQLAVWQIRRFWLDAIQCEHLNSWFYGWTLTVVCGGRTSKLFKAEFELASLLISRKIIGTISVGWIQTVSWSTEVYYFAKL